MNPNTVISALDVALSIIFAVLIVRQYLARKKMHQLMWGLAIIFWTIGVAAELLVAMDNTWTEWPYRIYYATGALLIPAWLGMGTLYLVLSRKWADRILVGLVVLSALGIILILAGPIDAANLQNVPAAKVPSHVYPFFPTQVILIILNTFGAVAFIGGALWSVLHFVRMQSMGERALATGLIAIGGLIAAVAHSLGVLAGIELFRISELLALVFIFVGFILSSRPSRVPARAPAPRTASAE